MDDLRYPLGRFERPSSLDPALRALFTAQVAETPAALRRAVVTLTDAQLDTPYRPDGWTVRQVVHHVPDSHLNAYVRFRLGLTEHHPTVKPYDEARWAELPDARTAPVEPSLLLLEAVHDRLVRLLRAMPPEDFARTVSHPDNGTMTLDHLLALYAWHGRHHVAQIQSLRKRLLW